MAESKYQEFIKRINVSRLLSEEEKKDYIHYLPNMKPPQIARLRSIFDAEDKIDWIKEIKLYQEYEEDVKKIVRDGEKKICQEAEKETREKENKEVNKTLSEIKTV